MANIKTKYFSTPGELEKAITDSIEKYGNVDEFSIHRQLFYYLGTALSSQYKHLFISDIRKSAHSSYDKKGNQNGNGEFHSILDTLSDLTLDIIIPPLEEIKEEVVKECEYDLVAWARDDYIRPLSEYVLEESMDFSLCVRNIDEHGDLFTMAKDWDKAEKYLFYFTTVVSSNMRRSITYAH